MLLIALEALSSVVFYQCCRFSAVHLRLFATLRIFCRCRMTCSEVRVSLRPVQLLLACTSDSWNTMLLGGLPFRLDW